MPLIVLGAVTLPHLDQGDWRSDTGWYSAIGVQAWRTGRFLSLESEPGVLYFNKPPLALWIHGLFLHVFGTTLVVARVPTILAAGIVVAASVGIAKLLAGRRIALWCGIVLALSYEFFRRTREVSLDMWQLAFMLVMVWAVVNAATRRGRGGKMFGQVVVGGIAIGLSLLCKPLMALVCVPMVGAWLGLSVRRGCSRLAVIGISIVTLAALATALPWHLAMASIHGRSFTGHYLGSEVFDRAAGVAMGGQPQHEPPWFYVAQIASGYWPWLVCAVVGAVAAWKRGRATPAGRLGVLAAVWFVGWLTLLTIFPDRRDRYALPLYPGLAWFAALGIDRLSHGGARSAVRAITAWIAPAAAALGVILAIVPVRLQRPPDPQWGALFAWLRAQGGSELWDGAVSGAPAARVYLETGRWPRPTGLDVANAEMPCENDLIFYHARGGRASGAGEASVFESGDLKVTRLEAERWQPVANSDPGEKK